MSDTAYPRLKPNPSAKELDEVYTPNLFECGLAEQRTREPVPRIGVLVLLKTFQRLGYFVMMNEVPNPILEHVIHCAGYDIVPDGFDAYCAFRLGVPGSTRCKRVIAADIRTAGLWLLSPRTAGDSTT